MQRAGLTGLVLLVYAAHQDVWWWRETGPMLFGFLPPGLWYHVGYTLAVSALMGLLVWRAWPAWLEEEVERHAHPHEEREV